MQYQLKLLTFFENLTIVDLSLSFDFESPAPLKSLFTTLFYPFIIPFSSPLCLTKSLTGSTNVAFYGRLSTWILRFCGPFCFALESRLNFNAAEDDSLRDVINLINRCVDEIWMSKECLCRIPLWNSGNPCQIQN